MRSDATSKHILRLHSTIIRYIKVRPAPPIKAREINGLRVADVEELLVNVAVSECCLSQVELNAYKFGGNLSTE